MSATLSNPVTTAAARILIADDQPDVIEALRLLIKPEGVQVDTADSPAAGMRAIERREYDVILMDLNYARDTTSGQEGLDLLQQIRTSDDTTPVIVMTAWGSVSLAVEAMRRGARDFIEKPWDNERLLAILRTQRDLGRALRRSTRLEAQTRVMQTDGAKDVIAQSPAMQPILQMIARVGPADANVMILGENGTGKGVVAQALHAMSPRASRGMVTVNAGGVSEGVFESELFGHVKGAFTDARADRAGCFELAEGGTLFLDEIANMPLGQQAKLLRVLQTGEYHPVGSSRVRRANVRLLAATNVDVGREVKNGRFREDLLYRLNTVEVHLPPLRERREDIPRLAAHFARRLTARYGQIPPEFSPEAMRALLEHGWPGNVRELEHVVERALLLAQGPAIKVEDLALRAARREGRARPGQP